jgi:phospholipase/lecithinase/hemolysin
LIQYGTSKKELDKLKRREINHWKKKELLYNPYKEGIVYKVTNKGNGMAYVGLTTRTLGRVKRDFLKEAKDGGNSLFHQALREWGEEGFV